MRVPGQPWRVLSVLGSLVAVAACLDGCSKSDVDPVYDEAGKLQMLRYDGNHDGKPESVSYLTGGRIVRIEIDQNEDGKVERWEYYDANQKLEKVGFSRAGSGREDAWSFADDRGAVVRLELANGSDQRVTRTEHYSGDNLVRAEEDTDGDGVIDKWETFDAGRLSMVAFDTEHAGRPTRRIVYAADGGVRAELDPDGDGNFVAP